MFVVVGLGNPGEAYKGTRHNVGRDVLFEMVAQSGFGSPIRSSKYAACISEGVVENSEVMFVFPETYMNHSGSSVSKIVTKEEASTLIVVYDDVDLPVGSVKVSFKRGGGGHKGVASIIAALGTKDFTRVRIGIAKRSFFGGKPRRPKGGAAMTKHVLGTFSKRELRELEHVKENIEGIIRAIIARGPEYTMNEYN